MSVAIAVRRYSMIQTGCSSATTAAPNSTSIASPTRIARHSDNTNSTAASGEAGRGSTPRSGATRKSGSENRPRCTAQRPSISAASWRTRPICRRKRMTSVPCQNASLSVVRTASCSAKTSATTVYVRTDARGIGPESERPSRMMRHNAISTSTRSRRSAYSSRNRGLSPISPADMAAVLTYPANALGTTAGY